MPVDLATTCYLVIVCDIIDLIPTSSRLTHTKKMISTPSPRINRLPMGNLVGAAPDGRSLNLFSFFLSFSPSFFLSLFLSFSSSFAFFSPSLFLSAWFRHSVSWSGSVPISFSFSPWFLVLVGIIITLRFLMVLHCICRHWVGKPGFGLPCHLSLPLSFLLSFSVFLRISLSFSPSLFLSAWFRHSVSWSGSVPISFFV
jgi:hypothetical protein